MTPLRIAIAGLGTVGSAVIRQLQDQSALITRAAGHPITIAAVSGRDRNKPRGVDIGTLPWVADAQHIATMPDIDVVVELIGGADGAAKELAEATLRQGKHLVTANKAMLAKHGQYLSTLANQYQRQIKFEAAVAGGIPIIKTLREAVAGTPVKAVYGILNGTCNYILSQMQDFGLEFPATLQAAQRAGYAEADPSNDIEGHDTAHKLAILAALAFHHAPDLGAISVSGITNLLPIDHKLARELGYAIKLLGVARKTPQGLQQFVAPCLVPLNLPLAAVGDVLNAVMLDTASGPLSLSGRGAGGAATSSAVIADVIDLAQNRFTLAFATDHSAPAMLEASEDLSRWYLRVLVADQPGVVAELGAILRDEAISIESLLQHGRSAVASVPVVMITHNASYAAIQRAMSKIANSQVVQQPPCCLRLISGENK